MIVLISVDPDIVDTMNIAILEKEVQTLVAKPESSLPEEHMDILRIVYFQNAEGMKPTYTSVGNELRTSRPTMRKRIKYLLLNGFLEESSRGRTKVLEISDRGKVLFQM